MPGHQWVACLRQAGAVSLLALGATACAVSSPPTLPSSPDPTVRVPAPRYQPVTAGTKEFRPVEPLPWTGSSPPRQQQ
jgi:hypothetical protein